MRSLREVSNLFICLIISIFNVVTSVIYVENGTSLILNPNIKGTPEEILWTYNGNKVAEHDLIEFHDYGLFKGRSEINISTGQLTVRRMTSNDSGIYKAVIQINETLQNSEKEVKVIDAVQQPTVTCKLNNSSESRTLFCSVSSQFPVSYEWTGPSSSHQSGQELLVSSEEKPDSVYTCTVKNEVSQKSIRFALKDCGTDEPQSYWNIILIAISVSAAVIVGLIAVAICCVQQRRNRGDYVIPKNNLTNKDESSWTQELNEGVNQALQEGREQDINDSAVGCVDSSKAEMINNDHKSEQVGDINEEEQETCEDEKLTGPEESSSRNTDN